MKNILKIVAGIILLLAYAMIILFIIMFIKLVQYDNCRDVDFEPKYCEKYKDF